ncbi:MAG TPA: lipopolysaccharide biosynthesis protein [Ideonella sp.]|uniref:lipopolysaccharide biosynthesis protein n=1 Tax=Ideonella sp. TaxID=1929293 RepID=UPI002C2025EF|nr:lipopolysaccharide biosynthesis protein [Ideonella sp.]HSI50557.1 lipopolysaccharide biosynthesis protein [Ideonella sp.]
MPARREDLSRKVTAAVTATSALHSAGVLIDIVLTAVLSRLLTPADYGIVAAAMLFLALCSLLREVGVGATVIQIADLSEDDQRTGMTLVLISSLLIFAVAQMTAGLFAGFLHMAAAEPALRLLSLIILIQAFSTIAESLLLRNLQVAKVMRLEVLAKLLAYCLVGILMAWLGHGYWALVAAMIVEAVLRAVALLAIVKPSFRLQLNKASMRKLLGTGSGFTASKIINFIALRADVTVVGRFLDAASLGIYSRAYKLMSMPTDLYAKVADRVVFPAMAKVQQEPARLRSAYLRGVTLTALLGIPLTVVLYVLSPHIIAVLLGSQWSGVVPVFSVLAIGTYFRLGARVSGSLLRATGSVGHLIWAQSFYAVLTIGGTIYAAQYGLVAIGAAVGIAILLWFVVLTAQACRVAGVSTRAFLFAHWHALLLGAVTGLLTAGTDHLVARHTDHGFVVMLAVLGVLLLLLCCIIGLRPRFLLGTEGQALAEQIRGAVMSKIRRRTR